jgi:uncharacterized lipoprotein YehR (DUF1307 family)
MKRLIVLIGLALTLTLMSCEDTVYGTSTYKYEVTGTATRVSITYSNSDGGTAQLSNTEVPWTYEFSKDNTYSFFACLSAQNNNNTGSVTVKIYKITK